MDDLDRAVLRGKALMNFYTNAFDLADVNVEDAMIDLIAYREAERETTGEDE